MKLSAIVITKNEQPTIARCLQSLAFADEIIVVDAESQDKTAEIAKNSGAKVFIRPWPGYGAQKNFGAQQAQGAWLLFVDADEVVTPELAQAIKQGIEDPAYDFYWLRIITVFLGKPLQHVYGHNPRLFKKSKGQWSDQHVHEQVWHVDEEVTISLGDEHSSVIPEPLLHYSHPSITSYLKKMHRYTDLDAQEMAKTGKHRSGRTVTRTFLLPGYLAIRQCLKLLLYRRGILDGIPGIIWSLLSGYYEWEMARKYLTL